MSDAPLFERVAIVGVGLMGGSLALALRHRGIAATVCGVDADAETLRTAQEIGAIDEGFTDLAEGVREANLVVFAVPVSLVVPLMEQAAPFISPNAIITDLASVKAQIMPVGERLFGTRFVSSHPMAGSEKKGITAARADLFENAAWFVVYGETTDIVTNRYAKGIELMAERCGARAVLADAKTHDTLVALVSHVPHALAFGFARAFGQSESPELARSIAGGSFRDIMRVAGANPALWADILFSNREALRPALDATLAEIQAVRELLDRDDATALRAYLEHLSPVP
jgi:prephenate dehydrogenase